MLNTFDDRHILAPHLLFFCCIHTGIQCYTRCLQTRIQTYIITFYAPNVEHLVLKYFDIEQTVEWICCYFSTNSTFSYHSKVNNNVLVLYERNGYVNIVCMAAMRNKNCFRLKAFSCNVWNDSILHVETSKRSKRQCVRHSVHLHNLDTICTHKYVRWDSRSTGQVRNINLKQCATTNISLLYPSDIVHSIGCYLLNADCWLASFLKKISHSICQCIMVKMKI